LLKKADLLVDGSDSLFLADIDDSSEEGKQVLASARHILKNLGKTDAATISLADMADIEKFVAKLEFNGDGVICAGKVRDTELRTVIEDIIKCAGSVADLSSEAASITASPTVFLPKPLHILTGKPRGSAIQ